MLVCERMWNFKLMKLHKLASFFCTEMPRAIFCLNFISLEHRQRQSYLAEEPSFNPFWISYISSALFCIWSFSSSVKPCLTIRATPLPPKTQGRDMNTSLSIPCRQPCKDLKNHRNLNLAIFAPFPVRDVFCFKIRILIWLCGETSRQRTFCVLPVSCSSRWFWSRWQTRESKQSKICRSLQKLITSLPANLWNSARLHNAKSVRVQ